MCGSTPVNLGPLDAEMADPLESTNAKIARAEETADLLLREVAAFLSAHPTPFRVTGELRGGKNYVFTAYGSLEVPVRFAVLTGEIMYQLRTALDHLLSALVLANATLPTDKHQFPIASTAEKFAAAVKRGDIKGVAASAAKQIEALQPFQPSVTEPALLNLLREFNNTDKHRALIVVGGGAAMANELVIQEADRAMSIVGMSPPHLKRITPAGTDFFEINLGEPHEIFRASLGCRPNVVIGNLPPLDCASVDEVVATMIAFVKHIVGQFGAEFR